MFNFSRQEKIIVFIIIAVLLMIFSWKLYNQEKNTITIIPSDEEGTQNVNISIKENPNEDSICIIHVAGAVKTPGVYQLSADKRIVDAVKIAGDGLENADFDVINLAAHIFDGQKIYIPFVSENVEGLTHENGLPIKQSSQYNRSYSNNLLNLNQVTSKDLENLPGIGPVLAKSILEYRTNNGFFKNIEDIMNVPGIGEKRFEIIKEYITVY